uniref:hypothetical protein n=2 Tax=Yoonia sp. TaxID=2212373 RepID=UPI0040476E7B
MNNFRRMAFLDRAHGWVLRGLLAAVVFLVVFGVSGSIAFARHAAKLWMNDRFVQGAHVLRWHLSQGWSGRYLTRTPEFEVSSVMQGPVRHLAIKQLRKRIARNRNASWGHSPQRDRFALLCFLAREFHETGDPAAYLAVANMICADLCMTPAPAVHGPKPSAFTQADAYDALRAIGGMLDGIDTPWYLVSGTFLGAVREGDFLSHDYDIDVGVHAEDLDVAQLRAAIAADPHLVLENEDLYIHQTGPASQDIRPALLCVLHKNGIGIDIFVHHLDAGQRWHGSTMHRWTNSDFTLDDYAIAGFAVRGPKNTDLYLTENYGNWQVPVTVFNCSTGTPNVRFNHNLFSISLLLHCAAQATSAHTDAEAEVACKILIQEGYLMQTGSRWEFVVPWARQLHG